jgi:hypothetical protein
VPEPEHHCHAKDCHTNVPPKMLMCLKHWRMVPKALQEDVWDAYEEGQEIRKDPTTAYLRAARAAINAVIIKEGKTLPPLYQ